MSWSLLSDEEIEKCRFIRGGTIQTGNVKITYGDIAVSSLYGNPISSSFEIVGANGSVIKLTPEIANNAVVHVELNGEKMYHGHADEILTAQISALTVAMSDTEIQRIEDEENRRKTNIDKLRDEVKKALDGFIG